MKIGVIFILLGFFLVRGEIENLVTNFFPGSTEILIGVALIGYGLWRLDKKQFFRRLRR